MEILVRKPDSGRPTHDDGDVFAVFEDGKCEKPGRNSVYWLIRFPGEHPELWESLTESVNEEPDVVGQERIEEIYPRRTEMVHRRGLYLDFDLLPDYALAELEIKFLAVLQPIDYAGLFVTK